MISRLTVTSAGEIVSSPSGNLTLYADLVIANERIAELEQIIYLAHNDDCGCDICMAARGSESEEYEPEDIICCICDKPIEGDDMEGRYWLHELGCDFYESGSCDCDLECHADCYKGHESEYLEYDEE